MSVDVKLSTVTEIMIIAHPGVTQDVVEDKNRLSFDFLVDSMIELTHGTVKPMSIVQELEKQLNVKRHELQ